MSNGTAVMNPVRAAITTATLTGAALLILAMAKAASPRAVSATAALTAAIQMSVFNAVSLGEVDCRAHRRRVLSALVGDARPCEPSARTTLRAQGFDL